MAGSMKLSSLDASFLDPEATLEAPLTSITLSE